MATETAKSKYGLTVKVAVVLLIFVQMTQSMVNPTLSGIMADFPDAPVTTVQTIINIATLIMIVSSLAAGPMASKLGYKTTGLIGMVLAFIGGITPALVHPSVEVLIFERAIFGLGYGIVYTMSIAACGEFWRGKETSSMIGAVNFGAGLAGIIYGVIASTLVGFGWEIVYYANLLIIPIGIYYAIVMPQHSDLPKNYEPETAEKKTKSAGLSGLGTKYWLFIIGMALSLAAAAAFMNNISMVVVGTGIDTTGAAVGIIMTIFTAGMMVGGALYAPIYKGCKRLAVALYCLVDAICFLAIVFMPASQVTLMVLAFIIGIIFSTLNSAWGDMANKKVKSYPAASALGSSIFIAVAGIAQFLSPFFLSGVAGAFGQTQENVFYQLYPAIAILAVGGIFLVVMAIINKNKVDYEREVPAAQGEASAAQE